MLATLSSTLLSPRHAIPHVAEVHETVVQLPFATRYDVLAVGGEVHNACCRLLRNEAQLETARGNLGDASNLREFVRTVEVWRSHTAGRERVVAHDLHPAYLSSQYARRLFRDARSGPTRLLGVQHHYAHVLAVMAEYGEDGPVIGIACDGTGLGADGAVWGCEVLHVSRVGFERVAHLRYYPLLGGDLAALQAWRPALALLRQAFGENLPDAMLDRFSVLPHERFVQAIDLMRHGGATPITSSLGRLFDAVAFLTGVAGGNHQQGSAARALEEAAWDADGPIYGFRMTPAGAGVELDPSEMIRQIAYDLDAGEAPSQISRRFHATVAAMLAEAAADAARALGLGTVAIGGGCFQNKLLLHRLERRLAEYGIPRVLVPERIPCGDGGLALGQAYAAARWGRIG